MPELIKAIILGVVEGITEFLPISSTGHLILVNQWITFDEEFTRMFDIFIQFGAILSVMVVFRHKLLKFRTESGELDKNTLDLWIKTAAGVVPALILGKLFHDRIEAALFNPTTVAIMLLLGGIVLLFIEKMDTNPSIKDTKGLTFRVVLLIGLFQCLALFPGVSRSAATIIGAMILGASRAVAVEFSFYLAIPTLMAASLYSLYKVGLETAVANWAILTVGFVTSFMVAYLVIVAFLRFLNQNSFKYFGYYRILLACFILGYLYLG